MQSGSLPREGVLDIDIKYTHHIYKSIITVSQLLRNKD